jgi:purine-cytosine permease-like protein
MAIDVPVRPGQYGERVAAVEPGGAELVPAGERHGRPRQLFWTWASPNLEFATVFVGVLAVAVFKLSFWPPDWPCWSGPRWGRSRTPCCPPAGRRTGCRRWSSGGSRSATGATCSRPG